MTKRMMLMFHLHTKYGEGTVIRVAGIVTIAMGVIASVGAWYHEVSIMTAANIGLVVCGVVFAKIASFHDWFDGGMK